MIRCFAAIAAGAILLAVPSLASAQLNCVGVGTCSLAPTASLTIPKVVRLATSASSLTLATPDFALDSLNGQTPTTSFAGITVRANHPWTINISFGVIDNCIPNRSAAATFPPVAFLGFGAPGL